MKNQPMEINSESRKNYRDAMMKHAGGWTGMWPPFPEMIGIARRHGKATGARQHGKRRGIRCGMVKSRGNGHRRSRSALQGLLLRPCTRRAPVGPGARWAEGPAWFARRPLSRLVGYSEQSHDAVSSNLRATSRSSASAPTIRTATPFDNQGRLVTCEHLTRRVTRTEIDGSISVIADKWNGPAAEFAQRRPW